MRLAILGALAQLLEVNGVGVEADIREVPNHRAAAFNRPPRSVLLKPNHNHLTECCGTFLTRTVPCWSPPTASCRGCPYHNAVHKLLGLALLPERLEGGDPWREEAVPESHQRAPEDAQPQPEAEQHWQRDEHRQF